MRRHAAFVIVLAALATGPAGRPPGAPLWAAGSAAAGSEGVSRAALLAAEANRAATPAELALLFEAAGSAPPGLRRQAVRAIGRLERPALVPKIVPFLSAGDAGVRAEAANALAQAAGQDAAAAAAARQALLGRLSREKDADAFAAACEAVGRLTLERAADFQRVAAVLIEAAGARIAGAEGTPTEQARAAERAVQVFGALRGLESLVRRHGKLLAPGLDLVPCLRAIASRGIVPVHRRLAMLVLNQVPGGLDADTLRAAAEAEDAQLRRLAAASPAATSGQLARQVADPSPAVRYEALRAWGRRFREAEGCAPALRAVGDVDGHVALLAIDLLGACGGDPVAVDVLSRLVGGASWGGAGAERWHRPAHALVSLAKAAPEQARLSLGRAAAAEAWQARMYAAAAATALADEPTLRALAADRHANVQEAALAGLSRTARHGADAIYRAALDASDNQLVITAAKALEGTPDSTAALPALLRALGRFTASGSDTARDPRVALLERVRQLGGRAQAAELKAYLSDRDPRVAELAAQALTAWTGERHQASPAPPPAVKVPTEEELSRLEGAALRVRVKGLGEFEAILLADEAPLSCARVARLAAEGAYDGLTFHRVVPNFLIQGGSPGANEYVGRDPYMRDEVGRALHHPGAIGISTRGRDTGDAQIYVVTVDAPRLDHDYTVFAQVARGMEVVEAVLEGAVIEKVEVVPGVYEGSRRQD